MTRKLAAALAIAFTPGAAASAQGVPAARTYVPAAPARPATGISLPVGKCVNMGNHLEAPREGAWGRAIADTDFAVIKAAGFQTIRLPVRWSAHAQASSPYTIDSAFLARVRHVVAGARGAGLNVILNLHHYDALYADPAAHRARFAALWAQIAAAFAEEPDGALWFELLNEPMGALTHANLPSVLNPALAEVRKTNPTRPVIVGGENWSGVDSLPTLPLPDDPYVVPTIHSYDPFAFTHQGATWVTPTPPTGRHFGSPADYAEIDANLRKIRDFMTRTGRVPFVGEYGATDRGGIPPAERVAYYGAVSSAYASIGVQSCAWAYANAFPLRQGNRWLPGMVEAIATTVPAR
ncbi:glycoside hydrolase family 5 protein [Sphingomonas sp. S2-65]|uniref:glycoside hydrolase family 5 protein n=1 Tax=Sphingomonas sp. S2-65 TaxID=2903960 RepID=UPI001F2406B1|nr:glycoside hydrolase family 5 protein [Sphingomonas sp. S2-65]UYY60185.1 glycoside hydrolase family 5 protein [Sphingomonas sp. S2-65]